MTFENMVARYRKISEHIEELKDVSGIGEKRLEALKEMFYCAAPADP